MSNVTLIMVPNNNDNINNANDDNDGQYSYDGGGTIYFHGLASVQLPFDIFEYYLDGVKRGQLESSSSPMDTNDL